MTIYAGLDVSDKTTHLCVVDADGVVLRRDVVASDPDVTPTAPSMEKHPMKPSAKDYNPRQSMSR